MTRKITFMHQAITHFKDKLLIYNYSNFYVIPFLIKQIFISKLI